MHGNNLNKPVYRIEYQRIHTGFCYLSWQMLQCRLNQARRQFPGCVSRHVQTMQLRNPAPCLGHTTWWVFIFAKRYEVQIGSANDGFNVRNSNKHNFMSSRLQLACKCSHRIQMPRQRHTQKANFHNRSIIRSIDLQRATKHSFIRSNQLQNFRWVSDSLTSVEWPRSLMKEPWFCDNRAGIAPSRRLSVKANL